MGIVRHYGGPDTFDGGFDYEDMLGEVFKEFLESPDGLGWKESKGRIEAFLGTILHNKIVEHFGGENTMAALWRTTIRQPLRRSKNGPQGAAPGPCEARFHGETLYACGR